MTLIVGIRCRDNSAVIGTDSAVTFGPSSQYTTIEQPNRRKIEIVDDQVIIAGTGALGLGQRFVDLVKGMWKKKDLQGKSAVDAGRLLAQPTVQDFASTGAGKGAYGALVAVPCNKRAELIEFDVTGFQPEVKTEANWYVSMGAGQPVADPLLGFVRRVFWGDEPPSRQDGVFAAMMVLKLACEMAPTGVALPVQMALLSPDKKGHLVAKELTEEELLEHSGNVEGAIQHFRQYRDILRGEGTSRPAEPPKAP